MHSATCISEIRRCRATNLGKVLTTSDSDKYRLDLEVEVSQENRYRAQRGISFPATLTTEWFRPTASMQLRTFDVTVTTAVTVAHTNSGLMLYTVSILAF